MSVVVINCIHSTDVTVYNHTLPLVCHNAFLEAWPYVSTYPGFVSPRISVPFRGVSNSMIVECCVLMDAIVFIM